MRPPIQIDTDTWIIMRAVEQHPKAIVHRVTDTAGEARFLLMTWWPVPAHRRMVGIYKSLAEADAQVPVADAESPPRPDGDPERRAAWEERQEKKRRRRELMMAELQRYSATGSGDRDPRL
ncbi:hypothetical protein JD276_00020 [Leucobacter sp. CSA1]|uniref:Uncharacterized protein n=1 Tax=Leucobacter chromiisoli TaxID=2796471 RepID=A0A934USL4_9MICO|nr:hypothetical protein [Leucobacter chromiisoli]MBK0417424.1 hypothetical protein [Leucobacter chromiisoli]